MANMYFVLFSYNSVTQAQLLLRDLKIAQCEHHLRVFEDLDSNLSARHETCSQGCVHCPDHRDTLRISVS